MGGEQGIRGRERAEPVFFFFFFGGGGGGGGRPTLALGSTLVQTLKFLAQSKQSQQQYRPK